MTNEITQMTLAIIALILGGGLYVHMRATRLPVKFALFQVIVIALFFGVFVMVSIIARGFLSMPSTGQAVILVMPTLWVIYEIYIITSLTKKMRQEEALAKAFPGQIESIRKSLANLSAEEKEFLDGRTGLMSGYGSKAHEVGYFMRIAKKNGVTDFMEQYAVAFAAVHGFTGENKETEATEVTVSKEA